MHNGAVAPASYAFPASYYAATRNRADSHPVLENDLQADVCVVGGGYTGIATALELASRGIDVVVLEARRIGWGASGRNGGQLLFGICDHVKIEQRLGRDAAALFWRMGLESMEIVREHIERYRIDCDLRWGSFDAAVTPRQFDRLRTFKAEQEDRGYPYTLELVEPDRLDTVIASTRYAGGLIDRGGGHLHPLNLCLGEAAAAVEHGARLFEETAALAVLPGERPQVVTARGKVTADWVVLAGNAYLGKLEPQLYGKVLPAGSYIIATEPLGEFAAELLPQNLAVADQNVVLDYFRLSADNRLLFGGRCNYSGREPQDIAGTLRPRMLEVFPQLENVRTEFAWGGQLGISLNRIPQLGRLPGNILYAQGYSGHGLGATHLAGRVLAEAICGEGARLDLFNQIRHWRLPGGRWFASPALALGMLYYRLLDLL